jgi:lipopolysaccharide export LptBFGC system permease protein LptF
MIRHAQAAAATANTLRAVFPAPFGWHTRHMLSAYLTNTFLVASIILAVALSIDLARYLGSVLDADRSGTLLGRALFVLWYIGIRATDRITEYLPLICFFGVLVTEIHETRSLHRLIFQITGRAPSQCLAPLLVFSLLAGAGELALLVYLRPAAVMAQAAARVGEYGLAFNRSPTTQPKWIAAGDDLVLANIEFTSSPPSLRDVRMFRLDGRHRLREILDATSATPQSGEKTWLMNDGRRAFDTGAATESRFSALSIRLDIDPLWLRYFGIDAKYLPNGVFRRFASIAFQPNSDYRTWKQARIGVAVMTAEMGLLAGCLSLLLLTTKIRLPAVLFVLASGYGAHILSGALLVLGEYGRISPAAAVWLVPILMLLPPVAAYLWLKLNWGKRLMRPALSRLS